MDIIVPIIIVALFAGAIFYFKSKKKTPPSGPDSSGGSSGGAVHLVLALLVLSFAGQLLADTAATAVVGKQVSISVTANGTLPFTYQWKKDGQLFPAPAGTQASYVIQSVKLSDAGTYRVVITNSAGTTTSDAGELTVHGIEFTKQPENAAVAVGAPASFTIAANAIPAATYQWRKNGTAITGATSATYALPAATQADAGSYTCVVTNPAATVTSSAATLTVNAQPPVITTGPNFVIN